MSEEERVKVWVLTIEEGITEEMVGVYGRLELALERGSEVAKEYWPGAGKWELDDEGGGCMRLGEAYLYALGYEVEE